MSLQLVLALVLICVAGYCLQWGLKGKKLAPLAKAGINQETFSDHINPIDKDFNWRTKEPERYRPIKNGEYKITMGIKSIGFDDYIVLDKNYINRTKVREKTLRELPDEIMVFNEIATDAVREYYDYVMRFFLTRFPMIFYIKENQIYNSAKEQFLPKEAGDLDPKDLMKILNSNLEDDYIILLKDKPDGEFILRASATGFPNGFHPLHNLNRELSTIHIPVPRYKEKLQLSMNRFFDRVKPYQFVYRVNWSIQTHTNLFTLDGNHGRTPEDAKAAKLDPETLDFNKVFMRCERQVLTKLPRSGALVLSVKTYLTPMSKIRAEGLGETMCGAIDGLPEDVGRYKNRPKWGDAIKLYMRGDTNGITDEIYEYVFTS